MRDILNLVNSLRKGAGLEAGGFWGRQSLPLIGIVLQKIRLRVHGHYNRKPGPGFPADHPGKPNRKRGVCWGGAGRERAAPWWFTVARFALP